jgi:cytochrome P450
MSVDYDPFSHEAMKDPYPLYAAMRAEGKPHFIEKYNAWALCRFEDVWEASRIQDGNITFTAGQTPGQVILGEMIPRTFMTMDAPDHRAWRSLIRDAYTPEGVAKEADRIRSMVRELLEPLLAKGEMDVYAEFANRVTTINGGYNLGLPSEDAEKWRSLIDDMLYRDEGQVGGGSDRNNAAAGELFGYLAAKVGELRAHPDQAVRHAAAYLHADIEGKTLDDEELTFYLFSLLVVGSETTPITVAGTLYHLAKNPQQKQEVLANLDLLKQAFLETARFEQPTNMLARKAKQDFELNGTQIKEGQPLLYIYASAERDEEEYENPEVYDFHRQPTKRSLMFGHGGHKCLGMHLGVLMGVTILEELLKAIGDYELVEDQCERLYGEHLSGWGKVTIRWDADEAALK